MTRLCGPGFRGDVEERLELSRFGARSHHVRGRAAAQDQIDGVDDDGFAGAGFAGEDCQPRVETDVEVVDDGKVADRKFFQHKPPGVNGCNGGHYTQAGHVVKMQDGCSRKTLNDERKALKVAGMRRSVSGAINPCESENTNRWKSCRFW
jgi:hypothetical protein